MIAEITLDKLETFICVCTLALGTLITFMTIIILTAIKDLKKEQGKARE